MDKYKISCFKAYIEYNENNPQNYTKVLTAKMLIKRELKKG